jgi:RNA polymerase sigma-70 factor (sigma-E family)
MTTSARPSPSGRPDDDGGGGDDAPGEFDAFVLTRGRAVLRFAHVLTGDPHLAEDLVQEVLARCHRKWRRIARMDSPEAYLRTAVVREYLSWRRRRSSTERVTGSLPDHPDPNDATGRLVDRAEMWSLLSGLPRSQRAVLVLRFYCDLPDGDIAAALGWTPSTVRAHASRALARLRSMMENSTGEEDHRG